MKKRQYNAHQGKRLAACKPMLVNAVKATEADAGHHYCFLLSPQGWRNQGMVPDNNRAPFIAEYIARPGITRIAFSRFCSVENPHHTHVFSEVL